MTKGKRHKEVFHEKEIINGNQTFEKMNNLIIDQGK